ncbi:YcgL domain-containing protein [Glaciecola sp.]|jgi:uncharacterized protein YcgL (UPF0745 family)|uniref:YcgL domain-containing protein n=1 Tax=Glaciecola sp. MF2-115 TaxID=3384827 RepID=UPI003988E161
MLCAVYKSRKKADTYLYVNKRDDFSRVPKALLDTFGPPQFVMLVPLNKPRNIGNIGIAKLNESLKEKGFYLQLPPSEESLLSQHRRSQGLSAQPDKKF